MANVHPTKTITDLKPGDHLCILYQTEAEHRALLTPFIRQGLEQNQKVLYLVDAHTGQTVLDYLRDEPLEVDNLVFSGQLQILSADQSYLREDAFDPEKMISFLTKATRQAVDQGYSALRVTGEMTWALRSGTDLDKLVDYEARLNQFFDQNPHCLALCQYDQQQFEPDLLLEIVTTHPIVAIGTKILPNQAYYIPPEELINQNRASAMLTHWLDSLVERQATEQALRESEELHRVTLSNITDAVFITDDAGKFTYICPNVDVIFKCSSAEVEALGNIGNLLGDRLVTPERLRARGEISNIEWAITDKTGQHHHLLVTVKAVSIKDGTMLYTCRDITPRKQTQQTMQLLREIALAANQAQSSDQVMQFALDQICAHTGWPVGHVYRQQTMAIHFEAEEGFLGQVLATGKASWLTDCSQASDYVRCKQAQKMGLKAACAFPVLIGPAVVAIMEFYADEALAPNESLLELMAQVGVQLGRVIEREQAEQDLRESEARFRLLVEGVKDYAIFMLDPHGHIISWNQGARRIKGYQAEEIIGQHYTRFSTAEDIEAGKPKRLLAIAQRDGQVRDEGERVKKDGTRFWADVLMTALRDEAGRLKGFAKVTRDITKRKETEAALATTQQRLQALFTHSQDAFLLADDQARYVDANPAACKLTGYSRDELLQMSIWNLTPALNREIGQQMWAEFIELGQQGGEYTLAGKDGIRVEIEFRATANILPGLHLSIIRDVTQRKQMERDLRQTKARLEALVGSIDEVIFEFDADGTFLHIWTEDETLLTHPIDELLGRRVDELLGEAFAQPYLEAFVRVLATGQAETIEYMLEVQGGECWFLGRINPIPAVEGPPQTVLMLARDITERKAQEQALEQYADRLQTMLEIDRAIITAESTSEIAEATLQHLYKLMPCQYAAVGLFDFEADAFIPLARRIEKQSGLLAHDLSLSLFELDRPIWQGKVWFVNDVEAVADSPPYLQQLAEAGLRSVINVPLRFQNELLGLLYLASREVAYFTADHIEIALETASALAIAIKNARLFENERHQRQLAESLRNASLALNSTLQLEEVLDQILANVGQVVVHDAGDVLLLDENNMISVARSSGYTQPDLRVWRGNRQFQLDEHQNLYRAAITLQPVVVPNTNEEPDWVRVPELTWIGSYLCVPIHTQKKVIGFLTLSSQTPGQYDQTQADQLYAFAAQAAVAIINARLFEQVQAGQAQLRTLSRRLLEIQEDERRHIARELHDEVGQALTGLKLLVDMSLADATSNRGHLQEVQALVEVLLDQVHDLSLDLRPPILDDLGLLPALMWHFEQYSRRTMIQVEFNHRGLTEGQRFSSDLETAVYRLVQEALTNIARHAGVKQATVRLWISHRMLGLEIEDRGRGFDLETALTQSTAGGLSGMQERANLLGGQLTIYTAVGDGTLISVQLPLHHPPEDTAHDH